MAKKNKFDIVARWSLIVGGVNWGLIAINPTWNLVSMASGYLSFIPFVDKIIYGLIGVSALYVLKEQF